MEDSFSKVIDLLFLAKQDGIEVVLNGERLQLKIAENKDIDENLLIEIKENKQLIIDYLTSDTWKAKSIKKNYNKINRFRRDSIRNIPLSFSQERLWFIHQLEGSVQYHLPIVLKLKGKLDKDALLHSLHTIIKRHDVLRTVFHESAGQVYQFVKENENWQLQLTEGSKYKEDAGALKLYIEKLIREPFDLANDYPIRGSLISLGKQEHVLVITIHHIASDAWSQAILIREVVELYSAYLEGRGNHLLPVEIQYADYANWQRGYLQGEVLDKKLAYWKNKLEGHQPLQIPVDYSRPSVRGTKGASVSFRIDKVLSGQLHELCQQQGVSLFMGLLAVYKVLLYRYSGQQDISVGTSIASRQQKELEALVGFFVNTLTLRDQVNPEASFIEVLQQVKSTTLEAYEYQDIPFEKVVEIAVKERDAARNPLFQVMLVLANTPQASSLELGELELSHESYDQQTAKFDITFFLTDTPHGLEGSVQYSTDLYQEGTITRMTDHFITLLRSALKEPQQKVALLPLLNRSEEQQLLHGFNDSKVAYPIHKSIVDLFEEQVSKTPDHTALVFEGQSLTYTQLNERSNQLAHYLKSRGVQPDSPVPMYVERSATMLIAMLGILKAGAAYVPIDTDLPADRISYMLADTGAHILVSSSTASVQLELEAGVEIVEADLNDQINLQPTVNVSLRPLAHHLAYVIYTSGSTGRPKGVMIEHRSLVDYYYGLNKHTQIEQCRSFALVSTIATDLGSTVIYASLLSGGALHVFSKALVSNAAYLQRYFREQDIDCVKIVPSHWKALSTDDELLLPAKLIVFGGEALQAEVIEAIRLSGSRCQVVNHYGPTETTIGKLLHVVRGEQEAGYGKTIPVGKPFSNTRVYVLSREMQLCPVGIPGQLYIAGDGLARGYLNNEVLTKQKFITDPFIQESTALMYGTGDLVKWQEDGNITFIGRADDQVKIRGYRVEPGEIESVLQQSELVKQAVVLAREDKQGEKRLVAYIVAPEQEGFDKEGIAAYLREHLPEYMVPGVLMELASIPLTANGKVDRKALPEVDASESISGGYVAPRSETEARLAAIWQEVLEVDEVGINDDFFELGGHSLLAVRLISAIRKGFEVEMPIGDIFDYPTVSQLAERLVHQEDAALLPAIERVDVRPEHIPLSFSQERLWFIDQLDGSLQYHVPSVLRLKGMLDKQALSHAMQQIINRHEVLRTVIREEEGVGYQFIKDKDGWQLQMVDGSMYKEDSDGLQRYIKKYIDFPFNLTEDYMLRAALISLQEDDHILVVTLHHIASDGWSTSIMVKELTELYNATLEKRAASLIPLPIQYADYALWERRYLEGAILEKKISYWKEKLTGVSSLQLLTDYQRPAMQSTRGLMIDFKIEKEVLTELQLLSQQQGVTLFMMLLTAFKVLLYRYSGQQDICVGTPIAGRQQQELEGLIGFFINTLALRTEMNGKIPFAKLLQQVRAGTLEAYENQEVPFEKVVEAAVTERDMSRSPLFQVMFVMQNMQAIPTLHLGDVQLISEGAGHTVSMFDLTMSMTETSNGLYGALEYCSDLYKEETILRMIEHYVQLLQSIVKRPEQKIGLLHILTAAEHHQLLVEFNDTQVIYPKDKTVLDLFEEQVTRTPDKIAIVFEQDEVSYKELNERSNRLAHYLRGNGIIEEALVPICINRSVELIVGILGILKAGGAYVPIDPDYPEERIRYMLEDIGAGLVLGSIESRLKLQNAGDFTIVEIDSDWEIIGRQDAGNLQIPVKSHYLAYVIYTSGSTGNPKGIMIEHASLLNYVQMFTNYFSVSAEDNVIQQSSPSFDIMVEEVYPALTTGACVYIIKEGGKDIVTLKKYIENNTATILSSTPTVIEYLNKELSGTGKLRYVITGGDILYSAYIDRLFGKVTIANGYGPSETTVAVTFNTIKNIEEASLIGKPIDNTSIYIISEEDQLAPVGVAGEICIGGSGLARGYLNNTELTNQKFVSDPFSSIGGRMYKTGDLGRWLPDGNIEYLGRMDEQVKIRGYRIELGEIEAVLQQSGLVRGAVVLAKKNQHGTRRLIGYVVPAEEYTKEGVIAYLNSRLPEYMVPALWVELEQLPLTTNGKIDRRALPDADISDLTTGEYVVPGNEVEKQLAATWQQLLGIQRAGIYDNFFELGGDSILTIQVVSRMRRLGYEMQPKDIFIHQTIARLSIAIAERSQSASTGEQGLLSGNSGLLPIQQWYLDKEPAAPSHFNQAVLLGIDKSVTQTALEPVVGQLMQQHDALRFQYTKGERGWQQQYGNSKGMVVAEDLQSVTRDSLAALITQHADYHQQQLDIEKGELIRVVLMQTPAAESRNRLLVVIHHLAIDGVSWRIILEDMEMLLSAVTQGQQPNLGAKSSSYRQWYQALEHYGQSRTLLSQTQYWQNTTQSYEPLPVDKAYEGNVSNGDIAHHSIRLPVEQTRQLLQEVPQAYHTEINDLLLCALALTLCEWAGKSKVVIGLEGHGRQEIGEGIDTSRTVGWFTSLYPLLLETATAKGADQQIKSIKEQLRLVPDKGLGYGILKYINKEATLQGDGSAWDLVFNYLGQFDNVVKESKWFTGASESAGASGSQANQISEKLSVGGSVQGGELVLNWSYSSRHYETATINRLALAYQQQLEALIAQCLQQLQVAGPVFTPSDYGLGAEISYSELDRFLEEPFNGKKRKEELEGMYRLSGLQQGMLFHGLYDDEVGAYTQQFTCDLLNADVDHLIKSWQQVMNNHSVLRSGFYYEEFSIPVQCVYRQVSLPLEELDYSEMSSEEQMAAIRQYEEADRRKGFDFTSVPLMRLSLLKLSAERYRMIWATHHILFDGWSLPVLMEEFLSTYELLASGSVVRERQEDKYEDYIRYIERIDKEKEENYWRQYLKPLEQSTLLPFIRPTTQRTKGAGTYRRLSVELDIQASKKIQGYAQKHRLTISTVMQGVWSLLLHRYTGQKDVVYGVIVSGRPDDLPNVEHRVGMYINTLPLHSGIQEEQNLSEWLEGMQGRQVTSLQYQYTPLHEIQGWAGIGGDLFDSILIFENYPVSEVIGSGKWMLGVENVQTSEQTNYPLSIIISSAERIHISFSYNTDLLEEGYAEQISDHFAHVLDQITASDEKLVGDIEVLTPQEKHRLLVEFNDTVVDYPKDKTLINLFEEQVVKTPEATAVVFEEVALSYHQLNERSNQLAHYLRGKGVKEETLVAICMERSVEMLVAIWGVLKAGGAYVPIDPEYPAERIRFMLEDTAAPLVVSSRRSKLALPLIAETAIIEMDGAEQAVIRQQPQGNLHLSIHTEQLAYVIYTSGSTGKPKGVMVLYGSLLNYLLNNKTKYITGEKNHTGSFIHLSYTFDASVTGIFMPLLAGKTIVVASGQSINVFEDPNFLKYAPYDFVKITPSHLELLEHTIKAENKNWITNKLVIGGEALHLGHFKSFISKGVNVEVINEYGPTESTVGCTIYSFHTLLDEDQTKNGIPVGKPIDNIKLYILDTRHELVAVGVIGEICLAGEGLARGYLNRPGLTAEKFVSDPFSSGGRMYKTGDLGRWLPDGNIEYLGRMDEQVKIRGYRIELGEIEAVLQQSGLVRGSVVLAKENKDGHKRLVAYVVKGNKEFNKEEVISYVRSKLPEYMVPGLWMELKQLPLTTNGKIDRKALPDVDVSDLTTGEYVAPGNEVEKLLAGNWQQLLGIQQVGIHDNFFELGGDSILTIQVVSRMRRLGYELQPKDIFIHQTIARLAIAIAERSQSAATGEQGLLSGSSGLLPIQQWYLQKNVVAVSHYNQAVLLSIDKAVTQVVLQQAITQLTRQHDALRFQYTKISGGWQQAYGSSEGIVVAEDLQSVTQDSLAAFIKEKSDYHQRQLDIEKGELLRVVVLQTPAAESHNRLLVVIHHLAIDGVSWRIILEDMEMLLSAIIQGQQLNLGAKSSSYRQWYEALQNYGQRHTLLSQTPYWQSTIQSYKPLPVDKAYEGKVSGVDRASHSISLKREQTRQLLQEVPRVYHTEINDMLLCALALTISEWTGIDKVVIGLEGHGREEIEEGIDTSRTVGWFTSLYPVLLETGSVREAGQQIKSVKEQLRLVPGRGLGYGVLKYINKETTLQRDDSAWDIVFNYLGQFDNIVKESKWFRGATESAGASSSEGYEPGEKMSVSGSVQGGELMLNWVYSSLHYEAATITRLASAYMSRLEALIAHCLQQLQTEGPVFTPSDYGLGAEISYSELDRFLEEPVNGKKRKDDLEGMYQLSGLQQGMLFHGLYDEEVGAYTQQFTCDLVNADVDHLIKSWQQVMNNHSVLRSGFYYEAFSIPVQCVYRQVSLPLEELDYSEMSSEQQAAAIRQYEEADRRKGFDFTSAPLMRLSLLKLSAERYRMVWTFHHILFDGWSLPVLMEEFLNAYESLASGSLPKLQQEDKYEDYIRYIERADKEGSEKYWRQYLEAVEQSTLLPFISFTTQRTKGAGSYRQLALDLDIQASKKIQGYAQRHRLTVSTVMQGVWSLLLHRYTGQKDVVYGVIVSGRPEELPDIEHRVGMYINTLPMHAKVQEEQNLSEWLEEMQGRQVTSLQYQYTPLRDIQGWSGIVGDLFDSILIFENYPVSKVIGSVKWLLGVENVGMLEQTNYPLSILISNEENINITFSYNTDLLKEGYVQQISDHFAHVLDQMTASDEKLVGDIEVLTEAEKKRLLVEFNDTRVDYTRDKTLVELFEEQVVKTPEATAVVFEEVALSYHQLNERSNQLAHYLQGRGVKEETLVAICMERSVEMLVAIWGVLKAGGAYVPIDPEYPSERIRFMLEDTAAPLVVSSRRSKSALPLIAGTAIIEMDGAEQAVIHQQLQSNLHLSIHSEQLAYVIYTSGSTGKPKGVMIEHRSVYSFIRWCQEEFKSAIFETVYAVTSVCFDLSVFELFYPLSVGKRIRVIENGLQIAKYLGADLQVMVNTVPVVIGNLLREGVDMGNLNVLNMAGEPIPLEVQQGLDTERIEVRNLYGPTEDTTYSTVFRLKKNEPVQIGKPIANTKIYIVNNVNGLVAVGVVGEICIAGEGLARGYLNRPGLTAEKFVSDPFSSSGGRMYKTGDLGRWLPDGNIEYLGRMDEQVKIRGYRIELGEIEAVLQQSGLVRGSVVIARENSEGTKRLIGYLVPTAEYTKEGVIAYLHSRLPEYMVPALWVELEQLPLTTNGKIDRKALPDVDQNDLATSEYVAPRNEVERLLAESWQQLLGIQQAGIHDNFFELGGDSILTIQVVSRMRRLGYELQPKDIFIHQTIARLSIAIVDRSQVAVTGEQGVLNGSSGLLPIQQWYLDKEPAAPSHFNQAVLLGIDKSVTQTALEQVVGQLMLQHDALRFQYTKGESGWQQQYGNSKGMVVAEDLQSVTRDSLTALIKEKADYHQQQLDIEKGEVMRVVLMQTPAAESRNRLLVVIHHLAIDGVSWRIILEDMEMLLSAVTQGQQPNLGAKSSSYRQWYQALEQYGQSRTLLSQTPYWQNTIQSYEPLPVDRDYNGLVKSRDMGYTQKKLDTQQTRRLLQEVPRVYHTEINDILLCALAVTLCEWGGGSKVVIGLEGHGREGIGEGIDTSRTVGWFTSLYPLLLETGSARGAGQQIKSVKEQLRLVPGRGLGYGVLKYINKETTLQGNGSAWDIVFNYLGQFDNVVKESKWLTGAPESAGASVSEGYQTSEKLLVNSSVQSGEMVFGWGYSNLHYEGATISALALAYKSSLEELIAHCLAQPGPVFTPSDYGLGAEISYSELDKFLEEPFQGSTRREQVEGMYRLSGLQQGMLFHGLYDEEVGAYTQQFTCDLLNADVEHLVSSWQQVMNNHSVLRSGFYYEEFSIPVQCVYRQVSFPLEELDYSEMSSEEQTAAIRQYEEADRRKGFDFTLAPLMRLSLLKLSAQRYRMVWTFHHILLDGWSLPVVVEEFLSTYESLAAGSLPKLQQQDKYEDYIRYIERIDKNKEEEFWRQYLQPVEQSTLLPFIRPTTQRTKGAGTYQRLAVELDIQASKKIQGYAQRHRLTVSTVMQGVWSLLLHRYTGQKDVVYGVIVSGRPDDLPNVEHRVGMYINTLPLYSGMQEEQSVTQWLEGMQGRQVSALAYQYTPLRDIQGWTGIVGDLFDSILIFENYPVSEVIGSGKWMLGVENVQTSEQTNYPLSILISSAGRIHISLSYNADLLEEVYVQQISGHFAHVLDQITASDEKLVSDIEVLTPQEKHRLLVEFNDTAVDYPKDKTLIDLFEEQVVKTPEATAVVFEEVTLSYHQLNERSNQLAHYLRGKGVKEETLVPVCLDRSLEMIIGIIAILKAGGAYVPIDPQYPEDRIHYMLEDTGAEIILSDNKSISKIAMLNGIEIISVDEQLPLISEQPSTNLPTGPVAGNMAYVIYTSGSTGKPKGAINEHSGVVNRLYWAQDYYKLTPADTVLQKTTFSFDVSVWELLWPLLVGSRLVFAKPEGQKDPRYLIHIIGQQHITMVHFVPSMLRVFLSQLQPGECKGLKKVLCSGEALDPSLVALFSKQLPEVELHNLYGPTEAAIDVTYWSVSDKHKELSMVPIGKPIANVSMYILDRGNHLVPLGGIGELCIGGRGPGRGYLNLADLTAEKFVRDPFSSGGRMYKTGDLGRWLPDGNIEYLGRIDAQVKIRGYRIELGEIEAVLQQNELVNKAVVLAKEDKEGNKYLVAYVVPGKLFHKESLLNYLKARLPEYMIPVFWVELEDLPLTPNGKIDRKALPEPDATELFSNQFVEPRNELETKLVEIWKEILPVKRIGVKDNFFDLGGHSLLVMRLISAIKGELKIDLAIKTLFELRTVEELANFIKLSQSNYQSKFEDYETITL